MEGTGEIMLEGDFVNQFIDCTTTYKLVQVGWTSGDYDISMFTFDPLHPIVTIDIPDNVNDGTTFTLQLIAETEASENSTEDEYVFFSTKCTGRYSVCNFAYSKDINMKKSDKSSLTVYHRNCIGKDKLKTIEVCSEFNNKEKNDSS